MRLWSIRRSHAPLPVLVAAVAAAHVEGAEAPKGASLHPLVTVCDQLIAKSLSEESDSLMILALADQRLTQDVRSDLAVRQLEAALGEAEKGDESAANTRIDLALRLDKQVKAPNKRDRNTPARWRTPAAGKVRNWLTQAKPETQPLSPKEYVQAVDRLYGALAQLATREERELVLDLALRASGSLEAMPPERQVDVALRLGILRKEQGDEAGAKEELRKALKVNPEAALPDYAKPALGKAFEELKKELAPSKTGSPVDHQVNVIIPGRGDGSPVQQGEKKPGPGIDAHWLGIGSAAVGAVALVAGVVKASDVYRLHEAERVATDAGDYATYNDTHHQAQTAALVADLCYAGAIGMGVATYFLWRPGPDKASVAVTPGVDPGRSSLIVNGRF